MKIGIDARMYGSNQTGIGNYIRYLTDALFALDTRNEYVLFLREPEYSTYHPRSVRVRKVLAPARWYSWAEQMQFCMTVYRERLDLVHFPHFNTPLLYRGPTVVTIHDVIPFHYPGYKIGRSAVRRMAYRAVFRNSVRHARAVIAVSEHTKKDVLMLSGIDPRKVHVTYLGVDRRFGTVSQEDIERVKAQYHLEKPFILYVGIWRNHKNVVGLIRAFEMMKANYPSSVQLVLAGMPDPGYPEVFQAIEQSLVKRDILSLGYVPDENLPALYACAKILAHLSFYEGNALTCLEAMACETPVVASDRTALPEILGDAALYADTRQAEQAAQQMERLLTDENLRQRMIEKGKACVKQYSWKKTAEKTLAIYESITAHS